MRAQSNSIVPLLMLILFLMSLGASGFNPKWLAHELDHDRHTLGVLADHDHAGWVDAKADSAPEPPNDIEHHLLHSACHFPPLLISSILDRIGASPAREAPILSRVLSPPPVELEPLFRPPRTTFRT